jgi:hypothetical protein
MQLFSSILYKYRPLLLEPPVLSFSEWTQEPWTPEIPACLLCIISSSPSIECMSLFTMHVPRRDPCFLINKMSASKSIEFLWGPSWLPSKSLAKSSPSYPCSLWYSSTMCIHLIRSYWLSSVTLTLKWLRVTVRNTWVTEDYLNWEHVIVLRCLCQG